MIKPIRPQKNYEAVMEQMIDLIRKKEILPGEKLDSIEKLANSFRVSRSVVREALTSLRAMGLIDIVQGEGTFVADFDATTISIPPTAGLLMKKEHIKELFEVRKMLEVGAVQLAASQRTTTDLANIKHALLEMGKDATTINEHNDYHFHYAITEAAHNEMLLHLLKSISDIMIETIDEAQQVILSSEIDGKRLIKEHELIYEAIKQQDVSLAMQYMLEHLDGVEQSLAPYIQ